LRRRQFAAAQRSRVGPFDLCKEAVTASRNGFHEAGAFGGIPERVTDFVYRFIQTVIEIHESVRGPELLLKFLASYDLAGTFQQHGQELEGLLLQPDAQAMFAQFSSAKIHLENSKPDSPVGLMVCLHREVRLGRGRVYTQREISGTRLGESSL